MEQQPVVLVLAWSWEHRDRWMHSPQNSGLWTKLGCIAIASWGSYDLELLVCLPGVTVVICSTTVAWWTLKQVGCSGKGAQQHRANS